MTIQVAVRKTDKYAVATGGDSVEVIERPKGGISIVLADGQGSGVNAKKTSAGVVNTVIGLIGDGVRDGAAARAAHDKLYAARHGKVSSTLVVASADLHTQTIVVSRNGNCPVLIWNEANDLVILDDDIPSIGFHYEMKPQIVEYPLQHNMCVVAVSDGITAAGKKHDKRLTLVDIVSIVEKNRITGTSPDGIASEIISKAIALDENRPTDDMSVCVLAVGVAEDDILVRQISLSFPYKVSNYARK